MILKKKSDYYLSILSPVNSSNGEMSFEEVPINTPDVSTEDESPSTPEVPVEDEPIEESNPYKVTGINIWPNTLDIRKGDTINIYNHITEIEVEYNESSEVTHKGSEAGDILRSLVIDIYIEDNDGDLIQLNGNYITGLNEGEYGKIYFQLGGENVEDIGESMKFHVNPQSYSSDQITGIEIWPNDITIKVGGETIDIYDMVYRIDVEYNDSYEMKYEDHLAIEMLKEITQNLSIQNRIETTISVNGSKVTGVAPGTGAKAHFAVLNEYLGESISIDVEP